MNRRGFIAGIFGGIGAAALAPVWRLLRLPGAIVAVPAPARFDPAHVVRFGLGSGIDPQSIRVYDCGKLVPHVYLGGGLIEARIGNGARSVQVACAAQEGQSEA